MTRIALISITTILAACDIEEENPEETVCDDVNKVTFYADGDGDGYGTDVNTKEACEAPAGYVEAGSDCDDQDAAVNPAAAEICDDIDNNCDDSIDEGVTSTFYADADGDGFGDEESTTEACEAPDGYVTDAGDCADDNADAAESCDAYVRFINTSDGDPISFEVGGEVSSLLYYTQSADYITIPAGSHDVTAVSANGTTLSNVIGEEFEIGRHYTISALGVHGEGNSTGAYATVWVNADSAAEATDIPSDHTRITLVNAIANGDNEIFAQAGYAYTKGQEKEYYNFDFLDYVQQDTLDLRYYDGTGSTPCLVVQYGVPAVLFQTWNLSAAVQVANNASLYFFMTCQGDCNSDSDLLPLFLMEDSSVFTVDTLY